MNSKEKGDICVGNAVSYYMKNSVEVLLPIGDKKPYDIVVDKGNLLKVQCKYTAAKSKNKTKGYVVGLRITGGNQSFHTAKKYEKGDFDILFVTTKDNVSYEIPYNIVEGRSSIIVGKKYEKYKI